jgi:hypothetical protein
MMDAPDGLGLVASSVLRGRGNVNRQHCLLFGKFISLSQQQMPQ